MMATKLSRAFATKDLSMLWGLSLRQLQWWDEKGFLQPSGYDGWRRAYSEHETLMAGVMAALRRKNIPLQRIRTICRRPPKQLTQYLLVPLRGKTIWTEASELVEHLKNSRSGMYLVDIGALKQRLEDRR